MLTLQTQIPTAARGTIRALVKAHPDWAAYLAAKGITVPANARNFNLLEFALQHPDLTAKIEAILGQSPSGAQSAAPDAMMEDMEEYEKAEARDVAEDTAPIPDEYLDAAAPAAAGFALDDILSSVDQLLAPLVRAEIGKALAPVIDAANKPPVEIERIVEVERVVEVAPGEAPRPAAGPRAKRGKKTTFRTLFPNKAKDAWRDIPLTQWDGLTFPAVPMVDPFYVVNHKQMAALMTAFERATNCWLTGPAGTGKSTMPEQACAHLGRPFCKIGMTRQTDVDSLIGGPGLHGGNTRWEDGALIKAMRQPGMVILIDELTLAPAGVQAIVQLVADDHRTITLPSGEVVKAADGVVFVVADNTAGSGDASGLYEGTNISNAALVTRFPRMLHIDYLTPEQEAEALANHTRCPVPAARHLADFVAQARRLPALQGVVLSMRQMVGFVRAVQDGFTSKDAFEMAFSSRMPAVERATIEGMATLAWSQEFDALVQGKAAPAHASDSAAAKAFAEGSPY